MMYLYMCVWRERERERKEREREREHACMCVYACMSFIFVALKIVFDKNKTQRKLTKLFANKFTARAANITEAKIKQIKH